MAGSSSGLSTHRPFPVFSALSPVHREVVQEYGPSAYPIFAASRACHRSAVITDIVRHLVATTVTAAPSVLLWNARLQSGGEMLFTIAFVLLIAWLLGVVGVYRAGDIVHGLLLVGLFLLLLAFVRARDAALRRVGGSSEKP